jgi:hypothetical protein
MPDILITVVSGETTELGLSIPGVQGPAGLGVPIGGTVGQLIVKQSATNYDTAWSATLSGITINSSIASGLTIDGALVVPLASAATPSLTFTGDTNTGIYSPGADQLAISTGGTVRLTSSTTAISSALPIDVPLASAATPSLTFTGDLNTGIYSPGADQLAVATNGTARVKIGSNGILSVGLDGIRFCDFRPTGSLYFRGGDVGDGFMRCEDTSANAKFLVLGTGNVQNANNSYTAISDIKLKENIVDANSQWDDLKALRVRNYNLKQGQTHTQIGLVAQEVEPISPGLVYETPDRDADGNDLGTTTKAVQYSVLYMKAVKALQEAIAKIETLEGMVAVNNITIDEQQHQLSTLAARLTALESA